MFGRNPRMPREAGTGNFLQVKEVFPTIEGEGPFSGLPVAFVRLVGCNLACFFCDTDFDLQGSSLRAVTDIVAEVAEIATRMNTNLVAISGGEPFRWPLSPLLRLLTRYDLVAQIETAGTICALDEEELVEHFEENHHIICSPKTPRLCESLLPWIDAFKYVVSVDDSDPVDGLPIKSTQVQGVPARLYRPWEDDSFDLGNFREPGTGMRTFVQPMAVYRSNTPDDPTASIPYESSATERNQLHAVRLCQAHGYRLSLQVHKIVGVR